MRPCKVAFLLSIAVFLTVACNDANSDLDHKNTSDWQLVYRNDKSGNPVNGNKEDLIEAVRKGLPIRIGFGFQRPNDPGLSVEHVADAQFLTIKNSKEVYGQITAIYGQNPNLATDTLGVEMKANLNWTMTVGTDGFSNRLMVETLGKEVVNQRNVDAETSWFVQGFIRVEHGKEKPLFEH